MRIFYRNTIKELKLKNKHHSSKLIFLTKTCSISIKISEFLVLVFQKQQEKKKKCIDRSLLKLNLKTKN